MTLNTSEDLAEYLADFVFDGDQANLSLFPSDRKKTQVDHLEINGSKISRFVNEFWTAKQRQASSIHEISYRACFKPQLPRFFIELLSKPGDLVYDPFSGRGTTVIEAALLNRRIAANDVNPLSRILTRPRLFPPDPAELKKRLESLPLDPAARAEIDLSMFFHPQTEAEIVSLRRYLLNRKTEGREDELDQWIRLTATNRLTGHSKGFFSVYTLPPNQAVSPERQIKINRQRRQQPDYRDTRDLILKKTKSLLKNLNPALKHNLRAAGRTGLFLTKPAHQTAEIPSNSVRLTVTSPPFLNVVQYPQDNWLRCWFNDLDAEAVARTMTMAATLNEWLAAMAPVFRELFRITRPGGWVAFEVGEVKNRKINLDEQVVPLGLGAGFTCEAILVNLQEFTKTSNIWGVSNNQAGTNTNRIVLFHKKP